MTSNLKDYNAWVPPYIWAEKTSTVQIQHKVLKADNPIAKGKFEVCMKCLKKYKPGRLTNNLCNNCR